MFLLKNAFFMFLTNFIIAVSYLKLHPAVHLNTSKTDPIVVKSKSLLKSCLKFTSFRYCYVLTRVNENHRKKLVLYGIQ